MGTELPIPFSPSGGETNPLAVYHGENRPHNVGQETLSGSQSVESDTTQKPASQEVRSSQGQDSGFTTTPLSDASATTTYVPQAQTTTATVVLDDVPVVANDDDLIEKPWVDSVKRIVKETRNDPYAQGTAIRRLQADYLQKRYGKTLGKGSDA